MAFCEELKQKQLKVDRQLERLIEVSDTPEHILNAMAYSLTAGGKRIRPILTMTICEALGGTAEQVLNLACAVEMIHTYSLIHDDLPAMDNDDLRRGKPTNHIVFGEAMAILAGDGLLNLAFELVLGECVNHPNDMKYATAGAILAKSSGVSGMIGGQVLDIESEGTDIALEALYKMHEKKTGALIGAACLVGCIIAGNDTMYEKVKAYSKNIGIAFQIIDDILDCTGDVQKLGKKIGSDEGNNKSTFVSVLGLDASKKYAEEYSTLAKALALEIDESGFLPELTDYLLHREN